MINEKEKVQSREIRDRNPSDFKRISNKATGDGGQPCGMSEILKRGKTMPRQTC